MALAPVEKPDKEEFPFVCVADHEGKKKGKERN